MLNALFFTFATGVSFAAISAIVSCIAHDRLSFFRFYTVSNLIAAAAAWIFMPRWDMVKNADLSGLIFLTLTAGTVNTLSQALFTGSMKVGHNGLSVVIRNSAALLTMLFGVIFLKEQVSRLNWIGVFLVLGSLAIIALSGKRQTPEQNFSRWLPLVLGSLLCSGAYQILLTGMALIPPEARNSGLRVPCIMTACGIANFFAAEWESRKAKIHTPRFSFSPQQWRMLLLWAAVAIFQYFVLLHALDAMRAARMTALTWPLLIGINVTLFSLFSHWKWKEKYPLASILGITGCMAGLILIVYGKK